MDTIREYVESVFAQLPRTSDMERLKEEILANMEEKYTELTAQGVPENEAIGTVLTEFGNIDEIIDEYGYEKDVVYDEDTLLLTDEEADAFLSHRPRFAAGIASGVFLCIMAPATMLLFQ
ncbi:permease prefix domain 1-containing protein, partial [Atopococcus tabaci]|uniref:permease prefix domain 1-containing protein n=1 Tax=Atopococcus tabaci TaxID=269774 RepID=UPI0024097036